MPKKTADKMQAVRAARYHVTFRLVPATDVAGLDFSPRARMASPYRSAIEELLKPENSTKILEFPNRQHVRSQLVKHARELGAKPLFAEEGDKLFVKLAPRPKVNQQILGFIQERPRTKAELESMVLNQKIECNLIAELHTLQAASLIRLNGESKWYDTNTCVNGRPKA
jgi:hypothetical protein